MIDKTRNPKVTVGRQYSSAGYKPKSSCFHLAVNTEKQATSGFRSKHSLSDLVFQCPPQAQGINSERITNKKYALCTMCVGVGQGSAVILEKV